jgi:transcriptional regulator with XRE-family HTH domain
MASHAKRATSATPDQIARNGHIAAALRRYMAQRDWSPSDFNKFIGKEPSHTGIYMWLNAKGAPGPETAAKLSKKLGIPVSDLTPSGLVAVGGQKLIEGPASDLTSARASPARPTKVLSFDLTSDGMARISFDTTIPAERAWPLLRMLSDAGLVMIPDQE